MAYHPVGRAYFQRDSCGSWTIESTRPHHIQTLKRALMYIWVTIRSTEGDDQPAVPIQLEKTKPKTWLFWPPKT